MFILIDGDDIGRKITRCYITNDVDGLSSISTTMAAATKKLARMLEGRGFKVYFCAADGIVAETTTQHDYLNIFDEIRRIAPQDYTFSAGVGPTLRDAHTALSFAKSSGKNAIADYKNLPSRLIP